MMLNSEELKRLVWQYFILAVVLHGLTMGLTICIYASTQYFGYFFFFTFVLLLALSIAYINVGRSVSDYCYAAQSVRVEDSCRGKINGK